MISARQRTMAIIAMAIAVVARRSTRHKSEITAITNEFGDSAKIIVPRSWLGKRVFLHSEYISKHPEEQKADE